MRLASCLPLLLVLSLSGCVFAPTTPSGLFSTHIYWTNPGPPNTIGQANLDGSSLNQNFIAGASGPFGVAVDSAHIYWANNANNTIGRANLDGSSPNQNFITGASFPNGVAVGP